MTLILLQVKYRKHKKGNRATAAGKGGEKGQVTNGSNNNNNNTGPITNGDNSSNYSSQPMNGNVNNSINHHHRAMSGSPLPLQNGNILKAALTNPNEVHHLRQPPPMPFDTAAAMINNLVQCDNFHDIAAIQVRRILITVVKLKESMSTSLIIWVIFYHD